jgi:DNA segregation ATPase FtsK/SpoIIIE-like protein
MQRSLAYAKIHFVWEVNRYSLLKGAMVRNIKEYNDKFKARKVRLAWTSRFLPYIILLVDEFADLIMTAVQGLKFRLLVWLS